jgi:hypothetical protein
MHNTNKTTSATAEIYQIKNWEDNFEGAKSKTYKNKTSCSMPTKHGLGYKKMIKSQNGAAIFGAWCALVQVLSRHASPRQGYCTDNGSLSGRPYTDTDLEILTDIPEHIFSAMFVVAKSIGWVDVTKAKDTTRNHTDTTGDCQGTLVPLNLDLDSNLNSDLDSNLCPKQAPDGFEFPAEISEELKSAIETWIQYKKEKKQKYKPTGFKALVKEMIALGDETAIRAINKSMASGWSGIHNSEAKPKFDANKNGQWESKL